MTQCAVRGCADNATEIFDNRRNAGKNQLALQWAVCSFHGRSLDADEPFTLSDDLNEILLGIDAPLQLVNFQVSTDVFGSVVTMIIGRDKIETERFSFQMTKEQAEDIARWV